MSYRCTNGFVYVNRVYAGGCLVADNDPILKTHGDSFAKVHEETVVKATEKATSGPGETRAVTPPVEPGRGKGAPAQESSDKPKATNTKSEETGS